MLDSGAGHHMVNIEDLSEEELATRRDLSTPIAMRSATQVIWVTECVDIWIYELGITVVASLTEIDGCPCVLPLGKLLDQNGFDFIWRSCETPYIVKDKLRVYCHTHHGVLFICILREEEYMMGLTDAKHPGGETSMQVKPSVTPTVTAKHKARRKKKEISRLETPPPPSVDIEVEKVVQARIKEKLKEKQDKKKKRKKVVMGKTCKHNIFTHFPKDLDCDICKRNKPMKARCESKGENTLMPYLHRNISEMPVHWITK